MSLDPRSNYYSPDLEKRLYDILKEKGWNLYESPESMSPEDVIKHKPTNGQLKACTRYVFLPAVGDPHDPVQVFAAIEKLAKKTGRKSLPGIQTAYGPVEMTGFTLIGMGVKLHTPSGTIVPCRDFVRYMESYTKID